MHYNSEMENWLIIGISGVTCGGKTTLATELNKIFPQSRIISQDDYFLDVDDPRHVWIPELNHIHFDIISSLDMEKMLSDIQNIIKNNTKHANGFTKNGGIVSLQTNSKNDLIKNIQSKLNNINTNILILEGFCILNHKPIEALCDLKYFFQLDRDACFERRVKRVYEPPDCPGYFERCVWPEYLNQLDDVRNNVKNVKYFDQTNQDPMLDVLLDITTIL